MPKHSPDLFYLVPPSDRPRADDRVYDEAIQMMGDLRDDRPDVIRLIHLILSVNAPIADIVLQVAANAHGRAGIVTAIPQALFEIRAVPSSRRRRK